ncbi:MAG: glycosyl hydrolase [Novosphingobium sp.]
MTMDRRSFLAQSAGAVLAMPDQLRAERLRLPVRVDLGHVSGTLPHIWSECAGSDRAAITLREDWRRDLDRWKAEAGLKRVRFHGIFNDELGVHAPSILSRAPTAPPNWQNVDRIYDGLVERGMSPLVELSFMPKRLASGDRTFGFYAGNVTPPTSMEAWGSFVREFVVHLADRYGIAAVRNWPFEVWNEPNLAFFWAGSQQQYFDLYKATAVAIKSVDDKIQVGGPATSSTAWIPEFLGFCDAGNAPVDFVTSHAYAGDNQTKLFGEGAVFATPDVIPEAVRRARAKIDATRFKGMPFWLTEWSCNSPAMIAHIVRECLPHLQAMSPWVLSGTYEELGVANYLLKEGDLGWGTIVKGIALPPFNTYRLLHRLGTQRLIADGPALASRRSDGSVAALVWNLADAKQPAGIPGASSTRSVIGDAKRLDIQFAGARSGERVLVSFVDQERGSPMPAWRAMGSPQYPRPDQIAQLRRAAEIAPPVTFRLDDDRRLSLALPPEGVALIEFAR